MLKIAICDDSPDFLSETQSKIHQWQNKPQALKIESYPDGDSLVKAHTASPFDIILLDVVMPLVNGIETAREIRMLDQRVKIIFLTSTPEFAVESYTVKANNYLLKPVDAHALHRVLDDLVAELKQASRCIMVRSAYAVHRVELNSIEYIEAQNKRVLFALANGNIIEAIEPFYTYEGKLLKSDGFLKCHRSYIVNIHQVETYTQRELKTRSGWRVPISRSVQKEFEEAYFQAIFGETEKIDHV